MLPPEGAPSGFGLPGATEVLFGLVVTDRRFAGHAAGLLDAAAARGWDTRCFLTDSGVQVLNDPAFMAHARSRPNSVASCKHSMDHLGEGAFDLSALAGVVVVGGQFQGAKLAQAADTVLVL